MADFLNSPFFIALLTGGTAIVISVWNRRKQDTGDIYRKIETKLSKEDYLVAQTRMGKQVDDHEKALVRIDKALVFLITRQGGNYEEILKD